MAPFKLKLSSERPIYFVVGQLTEVLKGVGRQVSEVRKQVNSLTFKRGKF